jgi:SAM-dependent methyltransferase
MASVDAFAEALRPFQPRLPQDRLIEEVNRLYHCHEARDYDGRHGEIWEQLPALWPQMIETAQRAGPAFPWRILDFGCGTGFASAQLLKHVPADQIAELVCYDPSPEMLQMCRTRIGPQCPRVQFFSDLPTLVRQTGSYHLVLSNSVLHHLPDPCATMRSLEDHMCPGGVWIASHEPSSAYYRNDVCLRVRREFLRARKRGQFMRPGHWLERLGKWLGWRHSPSRRAARDAFRTGLFGVRPSPRLITRLVDFHRGLSLATLRERLEPRWQLLWTTSYSFLGPTYEGNLSPAWQRRCQDLAERFPLDGANFSTVWRLPPTPGASPATSRRQANVEPVHPHHS